MDSTANESLKIRIRQGRAKFLAMAATYCAGVLNDNLFRQVALLMAVAAGKSYLQGVAMFIFTLPFILFASPAGYLADKFTKRTIVIASKFLELAAMILAAAGIYYLNWPLIMVTLFIMTLQSTIFSPALNGSIPELYPAEYIITANGIIRMVATGAILAGTAVGGVILDIDGIIGEAPAGRVVAALTVIGIAFVGVIVSFGVPRFPAASPQAPFPWSGPIDTLKSLYNLREDRLLNVAIWAKAFFWTIGALQIQVINQLGLEQFKLSNTMTSAMITIELVGIAVGSLLATRLSKGPHWHNVLVPSAAIMTLCMFVVATVPYLPQAAGKTVIVLTLGMLGVAGGVYSVPLSGFLQFRPAREVVGKIIAVGNFADFVGILISGGAFYLLNHLEIKPSNCYAIMGLTMAIVTGWLFIVLPKVSKDA